MLQQSMSGLQVMREELQLINFDVRQQIQHIASVIVDEELWMSFCFQFGTNYIGIIYVLTRGISENHPDLSTTAFGLLLYFYLDV